ncbi:hypothetical protein AG1IA_02661 [Rhizoctonia solani AG-1 IA]|uniref:Uncharacterized protein n=1 Tax=Thanatephorus cucumeris (strain AG1-IA) TaxID=983506 RepID=L8X3U9_THACA|nr:hypothetical protein AG1IA_02661 [Rhizoctonia solani AG-1 IA]
MNCTKTVLTPPQIHQTHEPNCAGHPTYSIRLSNTSALEFKVCGLSHYRKRSLQLIPIIQDLRDDPRIRHSDGQHSYDSSTMLKPAFMQFKTSFETPRARRTPYLGYARGAPLGESTWMWIRPFELHRNAFLMYR